MKRLCLLRLPFLAGCHRADLDLVQLGRELVVEHKLIGLSHVLQACVRMTSSKVSTPLLPSTGLKIDT